MTSETYVSGGSAHKMTIHSAPADGKKHPVTMLVHGNFGLGPHFRGITLCLNTIST